MDEDARAQGAAGEAAGQHVAGRALGVVGGHRVVLLHVREHLVAVDVRAPQRQVRQIGLALGTEAVTRGLDGSASEPPHWSRWFRLVDTRAVTGVSLMQGQGDKPLLVLSRQDEGRVALLLSVGTALASNPIGYLVPCHRVLRSTGLFKNYRWGAVRRHAMLAWEAANN